MINANRHIEKAVPVSEYIACLFYVPLYGLVKYIPSPFGDPARWMLARIFGMKSGWGWIREGVTIQFPWRVRMGSGWSLNEGVQIIPGGTVYIGNDVRIAPRVMIVATNHVFSNPHIPIKCQGFANADVRIESDVWIGAHAVILAGCTIRRGAVVGAGAVVNRDVDSMQIVGGVPAKPIGRRDSAPVS